MGDLIGTFGPSSIQKGLPFPNAQKFTRRYNPTTGYIYTAEYTGASQASMLQLQTDLVNAGIACDLTFIRDSAMLSYEDSTQQFTLDTWQIVGNEETRDGFSHPTVTALVTAYGSGCLATARNDLANNVDLDQFLLDLQNNDGFSDQDAVTMGLFYSLNQAGSQEYRKGQYVLRHTTNVSNQWQSNIADFGVDELYSTAQLLTEIGSSALWINPCPGRLQYKIANIPIQTFQPDYLWGWLKAASTETSAANNRVDIAQDYTLEQFSLAYYNAYAG